MIDAFACGVVFASLVMFCVYLFGELNTALKKKRDALRLAQKQLEDIDARLERIERMMKQ